MNRFVKTIRVVANPYFALDHKARPCGAFPLEPGADGQNRGYLGARVDRLLTRVLGTKEAGDIREPLQDTVFSFSKDPVEVLANPYYLGALRCGAILPADEKSASVAGLKFLPPEQAIANAKAEAIAKFDADYGPGAYEHFHEKSAQVPTPDAPLSAGGDENSTEASTPDAKPRRAKQGADS